MQELSDPDWEPSDPNFGSQIGRGYKLEMRKRMRME